MTQEVYEKMRSRLAELAESGHLDYTDLEQLKTDLEQIQRGLDD